MASMTEPPSYQHAMRSSSAVFSRVDTRSRRRGDGFNIALLFATLGVVGMAVVYISSGGSDVVVGATAGKSKLLGASRMLETDCDAGDYRKRTLQLAYEIPMVALFRDMKGQRKHEASDVIKVGDTIYTVCDSSWAIARFPDTLQPFGDENLLVGDPAREGDDSGYEAIFHESGTFYVIRESIEIEADNYHAIVEELDIGDSDYTIKDQCPCEFEFEGDSKGFEGAIAVRNLDFEVVILGLCEGNHCSEKKKGDKGHGRIVAMKKVHKDDGSCEWATLRTIKIPKSADFTDYSAITMDANGRVAISSQEDSAIWIGQLTGKMNDGVWDVDQIEFDEDSAKVYSFPKNDQCATVYCNIEGIHWVNDDMLVAVSDKMKKSQDFRCFDKDQSVHMFVLP